MDAREPQFPHEFCDAVIFMGYSFGLEVCPDRQVAMLRHYYNIMRPTAVLVGTTVDALDTQDEKHLAYYAQDRQRSAPARVRASPDRVLWMR